VAAWRFDLTTPGLAAIADLTSAMHGRRMSYRLNRPAQLTFRIASDHEAAATIQPDGLPAIASLRRVVVGYRREAGEWVERYAGHVWPVQDTADENVSWTTVTCFDPLQRMSKRAMRIHDGASAGQIGRVTFSEIDKALIAKFLVDDTNFYAGESGLTTTGGTFEQVGDTTAEWDRKRVSDGLTDLSDSANGIDLDVRPFLVGGGVFAQMSAYGRLGTTSPNVTFGWGRPPFNVRRMENLEDPLTIANRMISLGSASSGSQLSATKEDDDSLNDIGAWEDFAYYNDIQNQLLLDDLTQGEVDVKKLPRKSLQIHMKSEMDEEPFVDFYLGDVATIVAAERMRGGIDEQRRIFGFDIEVSDEGVETVQQVYVEEEVE
jgi:hypothetical protein